jgi:chromosome segregation ATPase
MSDPVIDFKQATINHFITALDQLAEHVKAMNNRYVRIDEELADLRSDMNKQFSDMNKQFDKLDHAVRHLHAEVISQANQIVLAQQQALQSALKPGNIEDRLPPLPVQP